MKKLLLSVLVPLIVGATAGYFTSTSVKTWYTTLEKPWFNPPNWLFGPVWTSLYIMMGIACWLVWSSNAGQELKRKALLLFGVQLMANFLWSFIFFYFHQVGLAFMEIIILWLLILLCIFSFARVDKRAAWLMVPYISWVTFAAILNGTIWMLNR
ncbi:tryptophan-rich sensory protein [Flavihumibacter rivuli]|uniref:TspO/MBR family protein n=1 Tax=Flavihumibacter rivuli TaxID=2838156 RepID=UPI001EFBCA86|nr:TspO/MBR family protein [Flavihumibacter rivuli]ULQ56903.1 tryptophan-rich sensory protein [Flavihumibacter rivuli]